MHCIRIGNFVEIQVGRKKEYAPNANAYAANPICTLLCPVVARHGALSTRQPDVLEA